MCADQIAEGQEYLGAMNAGINCALANRQILTHLTREGMQRIDPGVDVQTLYDVSHNTCKLEAHEVDGQTRHLYVHRKGATRAFGPGHSALPNIYRPVGQPVVVGGSMGTGSYILAGNPPSIKPCICFRQPWSGKGDEQTPSHQAMARTSVS